LVANRSTRAKITTAPLQQIKFQELASLKMCGFLDGLLIIVDTRVRSPYPNLMQGK
jgi:hypothetical protein